jgi:endonuclease-3
MNCTTPDMSLTDLADTVLKRLRKIYPAPQSALAWSSPWELLVSTVLAAQCTDARVNQVTPEFFRRWPTISALARARIEEVEEVIRTTGFFRNKAKNLVAAARRVTQAYEGTVPATMEELLTLPGVARKTANIVLSNAFGRYEGIAVDTHVRRLAFRLGLTASRDPKRIEQDLMPLFPRQSWGEINHLLVWHGRDTCQARKPRCSVCPLEDVCPRCGVEAPG